MSDLKINYSKYSDDYNPVAISWEYLGKTIELGFDEPICAIFSEKTRQVVVEIFSRKRLEFYSQEGFLDSSEETPSKEGFSYRGISKNKKTETGLVFLFHPEKGCEINEWGDTAQYELTSTVNDRLGDFVGIYR